MVSTLDDTKRSAIATKLAEMKAIQELLITTEQQLLTEVSEPEIVNDIRKMLESDQKNIGIIDTVVVQYGVKGQPKQTTQQLVEKTKELMQGSDLTTYEKTVQFELLKHGQTMAGIIVHKAAQVVGADIEAAITP